MSMCVVFIVCKLKIENIEMAKRLNGLIYKNANLEFENRGLKMELENFRK